MITNANNLDKNNTKSPRLGRLRNLSPPSREKPSNNYMSGTATNYTGANNNSQSNASGTAQSANTTQGGVNAFNANQINTDDH